MSDEQDRNFDTLVSHFDQRIYGTGKGRIRLEVIWQQLCATLPGILEDRPLRILDAGCGTAALASRLAGHHDLTLCDISRGMLDAARETLGSRPAGPPVRFLHVPLQSLVDEELEPFDLILCHAVLEWLADPQQAVNSLKPLLKPAGHLSLLFYNLHSLVFRNLVRGNLRKVDSGNFAGEPGGLTPQHPLAPEAVMEWLDQAGYMIVSHGGVRTFYDLMQPAQRDRISLDDLIGMEQRFGGREPYRSLARYQHLICRPQQRD